MKLSKIDNQIVQILCKKAGVKLQNNWKTKKAGGRAFLSRRIIKIAATNSKNKHVFISTFLHELGHFYALDNGIYPAYHWYLQGPAAYKRTALKAERWVDKWGRQLCQELFPEIKYRKSYNTKHEVTWLYKENGWKTK